MKPELPQPFDQEDIRKDPKAVVIGLLIGMLILSCGALIYLFERTEKKDTELAKLYQQIVEYRTEKANYYERMLLLERTIENREKQDTLLRQKTEPLVQKILQ